jgi:ABC-type lipoprotein release transport system permease subunit
MRALLTTLGIVIGVGAVIAMMEIGNGSSTAIKKSIASMGANTILILPGTAASGGVSFGSGSVTTLTPQDYEAVLRECPAISSAAPVVRARTQVVYGNRNWVPSAIAGTTPSFLNVRDWGEPADGEVFTERDVLNANKVCMLGKPWFGSCFRKNRPLARKSASRTFLFGSSGCWQPKVPT